MEEPDERERACQEDTLSLLTAISKSTSSLASLAKVYIITLLSFFFNMAVAPPKFSAKR